MNELNILVKNKNFESEKDLIPLIFSDESYEIFEDDKSIFDALVKLELFNSKSEARKNWKFDKEFPLGYSEFKSLGKYKKGLFIFNPIKTIRE